MENTTVAEKLLSRQQDIAIELQYKRYALEDLTCEMRFLSCEYTRIQHQLWRLGMT